MRELEEEAAVGEMCLLVQADMAALSGPSLSLECQVGMRRDRTVVAPDTPA